MVDIAANDPHELSQYSTESNTRVTYDGRIELSSLNEISNADLRELDKNGVARSTQMDTPSEPKGWGILMQKLAPEAGEMTQQTLPVLPMSREIYTQDGPLIAGPGPPDVTQQAKIAAPAAPRLEVVEDTPGGFEAGWVALVYGWIASDGTDLAAGNVHTTPYMTEPSPRKFLNILFDGQCPVVTLPTTVPKGVIGIYVAMSAPQTTQNNAALATLYIQRRIDIRAGQIITYRLPGPLDRSEPAPTTNKTNVGGYREWGTPEREYRHADSGVMYSFSTELGWKFRTMYGESKPQTETVLFQSSHIGEHQKLCWKPRNLPANAISWQPIFSKGSAHYALGWRGTGTVGSIQSNDPDRIRFATEKVNYSNTGQDQTGLPNPDTEFETVSLIGRPQMEVGDYRVKAFWYDDELQKSAPSPPGVIYGAGATASRVTIPSLGFTIKVYRPQFGNAIPNASGALRDRTNTASMDPLGYTITRSGNFASILTDTGKISVTDTSGATVTEAFALTDFTDIMDEDPADRFYHMRAGVKVTRYTSGRVNFAVRYYDKAKNFISTGGAWGSVGAAAGGATNPYILNNTVYVRRQIAKGSAVVPAGVTVDEAIPPTAKFFRVEARAVGQTAGTGNGVRNMDYTVTGFGAMQGLTIPRRLATNTTPTPDVEQDVDLYPPGGIAAIELLPDASKKHSDLAAKAINAFIYFGPFGTPSFPGYGISGFATPVKGGTTKRYSIYAEYQGVSVQTNALKVVCKDRFDQIVADYGYMVPSAVGTISPTRFSKTLAIPADGSYVVLDEPNLSDGFWRIIAPQMQAGSTTSAWTNDHAPSGSRSWIFDAGVPGCAEGTANEHLSVIHRVVSGLTAELDGSDATDSDFAGTLISTTFATSAGRDPYFFSSANANPLLVPKQRYWKITLNLSTSNIAITPYATATGIQVLRPYGVLLQADGSEFPNGGCILQSFPPVDATRKRQEFFSDSNVWAQYISGEWVYRMTGVNLLCQSREGAEAVMAYRSSGLPFILESSLRKRRIQAFVPPTSEIEFSIVEDGLTFDAYAPDGRWEEQAADGVEFIVTDEVAI